jgi:hypothetical protein
MKIARYLALLFSLNCVPARAYEVEIGSVLVCDTQKQVERFVQIFDQNLEAAISVVNTEENNPTACAMVDIAYVQGRQLGMARSASHTFKIIPVVVVATNTPSGYRPVEPTPSLMLAEIREFAV